MSREKESALVLDSASEDGYDDYVPVRAGFADDDTVDIGILSDSSLSKPPPKPKPRPKEDELCKRPVRFLQAAN